MNNQYKHLEEVEEEYRKWYDWYELNGTSDFSGVITTCIITDDNGETKYFPLYRSLPSVDGKYSEYVYETRDIKDRFIQDPEFDSTKFCIKNVEGSQFISSHIVKVL